MGLLAGPEPEDEQEERRYPGKPPVAHKIWSWCQENDVNIRQLALHFCLAADIDGMVMAGPATQQQVEEVIEAAQTPPTEDVWQAFEAEFGIRG